MRVVPYGEAATLAGDATFRPRVIACAVRFASDLGVQILAKESPTPDDKARLGFAQDLLTDPQTWAVRMAWLVAVQPGITSASTDDDLLAQVQRLWDVIARVPI